VARDAIYRLHGDRHVAADGPVGADDGDFEAARLRQPQDELVLDFGDDDGTRDRGRVLVAGDRQRAFAAEGEPRGGELAAGVLDLAFALRPRTRRRRSSTAGSG
jgi:hypothetical protein